jgi:hypothetical protein
MQMKECLIAKPGIRYCDKVWINYLNAISHDHEARAGSLLNSIIRPTWLALAANTEKFITLIKIKIVSLSRRTPF